MRLNVGNLRHAPFGRLPWMSGTGRSSVLNLRAEAETEKKEEGEKAAATDVKVDLEKDISKVNLAIHGINLSLSLCSRVA